MKKEIKNENRLYLIFLAGCLLFFCSLLLQGSTLPFVGVNSWNFNTYALIAENYLRFGYFATKLAPVVSVAQILPGQPEYYLHHPQLLSITMSLFFTVLGESFFIARLPVILASLVSAILFYKIGSELLGKKYGMICLAVSILLPAASIFGRMVGQEAFVLMFALLATFFFLRFMRSNSFADGFLALLSVILGSFSDWPMAYFVLMFGVFAYQTKSKRLYLGMLGATIITNLIYLFYSVYLAGSTTDLSTAFLVRSTGALLSDSGWYLVWPATIFTRLLIYMNPVVLIFSVLGFVSQYRIRKNDLTKLFYLTLGFLLFGLLHVLLYPEGSFGHAYWIYYLIPSVVFSAAYILLKFEAHRTLLLVIFILGLAYVVFVVDWKTGETRGNVFRYNLAKVVSDYIPPYSRVDVNPGSAVDPDLLAYWFDFNSNRILSGSNSDGYRFFSCSSGCSGEDMSISEKLGSMPRIVINSPEVSGFLIYPAAHKQNENYINIIYRKNDKPESVLRRLYIELKEILNFPQL